MHSLTICDKIICKYGMIPAKVRIERVKVLVFSRLDSSVKHVKVDVLKVLLYSKMHFNSRQLPNKTHHTYTKSKSVNKFGKLNINNSIVRVKHNFRANLAIGR